MKRKESWRRAVIVLGITFVFGGITGENIPQVVCANPYYCLLYTSCIRQQHWKTIMEKQTQLAWYRSSLESHWLS